MRGKRDYSCEIMALTVLMALSALSHFWYIMIAMGAAAAAFGASVVLSKIFLRAQRQMLAHLLSQPGRKDTRPDPQMSVPGPSQSLPAA